MTTTSVREEGAAESSPAGLGSGAAMTTTLTVEEVRSRLEEANRKGKMPEVEWMGRERFRIVLPSRPLLSHLNARIDGRSIRFDVTLSRKAYWGIVIANLVLVAVSQWLSDWLIKPNWLYSWYWYPASGVLLTLWIAWRWPVKSRADADELAVAWIKRITGRLGGG